MARHKIIITTYGFNKPGLMSEQEFNSFKQIYSVEPNYNMAPKRSFWDEFAAFKWCLIIMVIGGVLSLVWDALAFIPAIALVFLIFGLIGGSGQSMFNYQSFLNTKNNYYSALALAIKSSSNYDDFRRRAALL